MPKVIQCHVVCHHAKRFALCFLGKEVKERTRKKKERSENKKNRLYARITSIQEYNVYSRIWEIRMAYNASCGFDATLSREMSQKQWKEMIMVILLIYFSPYVLVFYINIIIITKFRQSIFLLDIFIVIHRFRIILKLDI